jgi:PAS domain S-box-containing protein
MSTAQVIEPSALDSASAAERCRLRQQAALLAFGRRTGVPPELSVLLRDALTFLIDACEVEYGLFVRPSVEPGKLVVQAEAHGAGVPTSTEIATFGAQSIAFHAVDTGRLCVVPDLAADQRFNDLALRKLGVVSAVAVPLHHCDQRFGALVLGATAAKTITSDDLAFLEAVSHLLAFAIARDKIDQILKEERLLNVEIYDALPQIVLLLDNQGRILRTNRACEELTGFQAQDLVGRTLWNSLAAPECAAAQEAEFLQTLTADKRLRHASTLLTKHGDRKQLLWTHSALKASKVLFTGDVLEEQLASVDAPALKAGPTPELHRTGRGNGSDTTHDSRQPKDAPSGRERRTSARRTFPYQQRVAPYHGVPPLESEFFLARFSDISSGGVSFILEERPNYKAVVIELGSAPKTTKIHSDIVRVIPIMAEGRPVYLIGCRFVERL